MMNRNGSVATLAAGRNNYGSVIDQLLHPSLTIASSHLPLRLISAGLIANLWGALVFKEVQGKRNLVLLGVAFVLVISSAVLISLSK